MGLVTLQKYIDSFTATSLTMYVYGKKHFFGLCASEDIVITQFGHFVNLSLNQNF